MWLFWTKFETKNTCDSTFPWGKEESAHEKCARCCAIETTCLEWISDAANNIGKRGWIMGSPTLFESRFFGGGLLSIFCNRILWLFCIFCCESLKHVHSTFGCQAKSCVYHLGIFHILYLVLVKGSFFYQILLLPHQLASMHPATVYHPPRFQVKIPRPWTRAVPLGPMMCLSIVVYSCVLYM